MWSLPLGLLLWGKDRDQRSRSEVAQSCLTLCDPMDYSLPGPSAHGILQAGAVCHSLLPGDLPGPGIESGSPALQEILYHLSHQGSIQRRETHKCR